MSESEGEWSPWGGDEEELEQPLIHNRRDQPQQRSMGRPDILTSPLVDSQQPARLPQYVTALSATLGAFAMGTVLGYSSPAGAKLIDNTTDDFLHLTKDQNSWFSSIMNVGALLGGPVGGLCLTKLGRRGTLLTSVVPFIAGWLVIAFAQNFAMLLVGRVLTGLCAGITSIAVPTYIAEFSSSDIRGTLGKERHIQTELDMMRASVEERRQNKASFSDLMKPYVLKPLFISLGLMFFQQFSGVNGVLFNLTTIFQSAGSNISGDISSIVVGVVQVAATLLATILMDKAGRKLLLIVSSSIMALSLVALGEFFYMKTEDASWAKNTLGWLPLVSLIVFITAFSIAYGPVPWLMMGELFSSDVKELAASQATMFNWTLSFVVTYIFTPLQSSIGDAGVYWLFSAICVVNLVFCVSVVPETKGKTLEEINALFGAPAPSAAQQRRNSSDC